MNRQQPPIDIKNMLSAVVISMALITAWQYFYVSPNLEKAQQQAATQQAAVSAQVGTGAPVLVRDMKTVLAETTRVKIVTPELSGSINLTGAQLDDLHLEKYRETVDPKSPAVAVLTPSGTPHGQFVEQGFIPAANTKLLLPDSKAQWQVAANAELGLDKPVTLTWNNGAGLNFSRKISISDDYLFTIDQTVTNSGTTPVELFPYARVQRQGEITKLGTWSFYVGPIGVQNGELQNHHYDTLKEEPDKPIKISATGGWLGFTDEYWAATIIPNKTTKVDATYQFAKNQGRDAYQVDYLATEPLIVAAGGSVSYQDHVYAGAKRVQVTEAINDKLGLDKFDLMIDWGWFEIIAKPMFYLLSFMKSLLGNFGLAILAVTVLVKGLLFPLANKSYASMSKMKNLKPQMDALKEKYPDDKAKQQQATMELYKKEKVNPMAGCLPIFIQIPIFFALYKVILTTIELRHAPFFGWIHDLSAPDPTSIFNLFGLIPWVPPMFLMIGFWPILMGITMWVQMRLNPTPPDPVQAAMFNWMPLIFTFTLGGFPAGLTIYWTWSNFLSILQQAFIMKKHGTEIDLFGNMRNSLPFLKKKSV